MWGIFFVEFQCLPVNDCSAVSCDSGALARGSECTSFYSNILNLSPPLIYFLFYFFIFQFLRCFSVVLTSFPFLFFFFLFLYHFCKFVLFLCFILQLAICFGFVFCFCVFVSFLYTCFISFLGSFVCLVVLLRFILFGSVFVSCVCVCLLVSVFVCLILLLPFVWGGHSQADPRLFLAFGQYPSLFL